MIYIVIIFLLLFSPHQAFATTTLAGSSATIIASLPKQEEDNRVKTLEAFLQKYNSPMATSSKTFIQEADKNGIDWRLLPAIAGVESTFGKQVPKGTNNAWGWGIYGTHRIYFTSFDEGITIISKGIKERYIERTGTDNVYVIGKMYASSPTWAIRVEKFMNIIQTNLEASTSSKLTINL